jgi:hypothetical protein
VSARQDRLLLFVAAAATALLLGLPLVGDVPGRALQVRVFLVATIVLLAIAAFGGNTIARTRLLVTSALVLLGATAALVLRDITPTGTILLAIAIGALAFQRRNLAAG